MKSPFPGTDPYLEQHWRDVHHNFITFAQGELNTRLPSDLLARVEERVFVEAAQGNGRSVYPDVRVVEHRKPDEVEVAPAAGEAAVALAEPVLIHLPDEKASQGYIEIVDVGSGNRVVTVLEVLSLANKVPGEGRDLYVQKQRELKEAGVSLVEIDLLRAGKRILAAPPARIPPRYRTEYQVCVRRGWEPTVCEVYAVPLTKRLPRFRVPLRQADVDVELDLQAILDQCYRNGRYDRLDYTREPVPPLNKKHAAWADQLLREAGKR